MRVLYSLCLLVTAVTASHWLKKRNTDLEDIFGPNCPDSISECSDVFQQIMMVMTPDNLRGLINEETGRLNMNCSSSALSQARRCESLMSTCNGIEGIGKMIAYWDYFCQNREVTERLRECWRTIDIVAVSMPCFGERNVDNSSFDCLENGVASVPGCGAKAGRLIRQFAHIMIGVPQQQRA